MHDLVKAVIEKHKERHKEVEEYLRNQGDTQIEFSIDQIRKLLNDEKIPKELGEWFLKDYEAKEKQYRKMQELIKQHPDISPEERHKHFLKEGQLSPEEQAKLYEDTALNGQFLVYLLQNRHLLAKEQEEIQKASHSLFNGIDVIEEFGIANYISNSLYHLTELLKTMEILEIYSGLYEAKSSVKNSKGEAISLAYTFPAQNMGEAKPILKTYQSTMVTKGLKLLMAHWMMANKTGCVQYSCQMTDIMKLITDEDREAFFSVKEKEEHWSLTKMLAMSKLSRERKIKKRGRKEEIIQWIEQPLLEIQGGEKEMTAEDKYPITIAMRVLMPRMDAKGFAPIIYKNNTTQLNPSDAFLAFFIQTRAGQRQRGTKPIAVDWDFIFEAGNLQATATSNHRMAKAQARKKMNRLQQGKIIERWDEELMGVCVTPKKQKKKEKTQTEKPTT